jgi:hypothetical protein
MKKILFKGVVILGTCLYLDGCVSMTITNKSATRYRTRNQSQEYVANIKKTNKERKKKENLKWKMEINPIPFLFRINRSF